MDTPHTVNWVEESASNMKISVVVILLMTATGQLLSQSSHQKTFCNPIDIEYRYSTEEEARQISYRSGADPVIVSRAGEYYLFVTNSGGWWHSSDLLHWTFVRPAIWPREDICAPAVAVVRDTLYLLQSTFDPKPLYYSTSPQTGALLPFNPRLPFLPGALGPWDPDLFHDELTDRWFLYFGSSNVYPIYGIEMDQATNLRYVGSAKELLHLDPEAHGWERFGQDHRDTVKPFIEGAWMTWHNGKYYLQYAAPGTEYNVYSNGTYVGDHPLGPFFYAPYNPVAYKPGGFLTGAGHGNTFQDNFGNYWNTGTPWVGHNFNFERRIAMVPAGFDQDGQMFANTRFGDFPHYLPTGKWKGKDELFAGWMLLSYRKPTTSSSVLDTFRTANVTDENPRTFWVAKSTSPGEWLTVDLGRTHTVRAVQINFADYRSSVYANDSTVYTQFRLYHSLDGSHWQIIADLSRERRDRPNAYIELPGPVQTRFIRYEHGHVGAATLAISDIRIFGKGTGKPPLTPEGLAVERDTDPRDCFIRWRRVLGAVGYNVLWGIAPNKLYQTYQVFADQGTALELRALNAGQDYYFAIESFNENGVSRHGEVVHCR
jgi:hypothetical protein